MAWNFQKRMKYAARLLKYFVLFTFLTQLMPLKGGVIGGQEMHKNSWRIRDRHLVANFWAKELTCLISRFDCRRSFAFSWMRSFFSSNASKAEFNWSSWASRALKAEIKAKYCNYWNGSYALAYPLLESIWLVFSLTHPLGSVSYAAPELLFFFRNL